MDTDGMRALRRVAAEKLLTGVSENPELTRLLDYFSRTAWLVETGVLDLETTFIMQEYWITRYWPSAKAHVESFRTTCNDRLIWSTLEHLADQLTWYRKKKGLLELTSSQYTDFLQAEKIC